MNRKPPKPKIKKRYLHWKLGRSGAWEAYYRTTWTDGGKRRERTIKLNWGGDPQELDRLYWQCRSGRNQKQFPKPNYTWRDCIEAWRVDPKGQGKLAESTRRSYRRAMDRILEKNGNKSMTATTPKALYTAHSVMSATPREADRMLQTVSSLWNYAKSKLFWPLGDNPATGIEHFGRTREYEPWPKSMVEALDTAPDSVRIAARLILGTGQRPAAAIGMRFDQFKGDYMTVVDEKRDQSLEVYCPASLRGFVEHLPKKGEHVLAKTLRQPLSYDAVEKAFRKWRGTLGDEAKPYVLHGLRKLAIIELAEAGATDAEIQAVTGQSAEMVAYYRSRASRKLLSRAAHQRRE